MYFTIKPYTIKKCMSRPEIIMITKYRMGNKASAPNLATFTVIRAATAMGAICMIQPTIFIDTSPSMEKMEVKDSFWDPAGSFIRAMPMRKDTKMMASILVFANSSMMLRGMTEWSTPGQKFVFTQELLDFRFSTCESADWDCAIFISSGTCVPG